MAGAAARLGVPVIVVRAQRDGGRHGRVPRATAVVRRDAGRARIAAATPPDNGAAAVLAGTLAAAEALHAIVRAGPRAGRSPSLDAPRCRFATSASPLDGASRWRRSIGRPR